MGLSLARGRVCSAPVPPLHLGAVLLGDARGSAEEGNHQAPCAPQELTFRTVALEKILFDEDAKEPARWPRGQEVVGSQEGLGDMQGTGEVGGCWQRIT